MKAAIALSALLVGVAFGHWSAKDRPTVSAVTSSTAADKSGLAKKAPVPLQEGPTADARKTATRPPPDALAGILQERNTSERLRQITSFVDELSPADFAAALLAAKKLPSTPDRELATRLLVARWADLDPDGALAFAANHKEFDQVTGDIFRQLAANDLQGALARAQTITDPSLHYQALRGTLSVMAQSDPAGALKIAGSAGNLPHGEPLTQMIYRQWSEADPASAAAAAAQDPAGSGWRSPLSQVVRNWADEDPQAALNFAMTMTDASAQARSVGDIVRRWSQADANAAASSINTMPGGSVRDAAAAAFASSVASTDVPTAVGWAQSISDAEARTAALQRVSRRVIWQDPANGAATLQNAGVPMNIIQNLPAPHGR